MPGGDRTGPLGQGPMTGRRRNNCQPQADARRPYYGRRNGEGLGRGAGRGYGYGNRFYNEDNAESLTQEKKILEERIKDIDSKLSK